VSVLENRQYWACKCGCLSYARIAEPAFDAKGRKLFKPSDYVRCLDCKTTRYLPAPASEKAVES
jgi:hypothetical protein